MPNDPSLDTQGLDANVPAASAESPLSTASAPNGSADDDAQKSSNAHPDPAQAPALASTASAPVVSRGAVLPRGPGRGPAPRPGGQPASGLRAPLMGGTSSTPIPPSIQARLAAVRPYIYLLASVALVCPVSFCNRDVIAYSISNRSPSLVVLLLVLAVK